MGCIYLITNLVNGKQYVGKTILDVWERWRLHVRAAQKHCDNMLIHRAIRKYGSDQFTVVILEESDDDTWLLQREIWWIGNFETKQYGYNLTDGGEGHAGHSPSEETRKKLSSLAKVRTWSDEHKQNMRNAHVGVPRSEETKRKLSIAKVGLQKGRVLSEETKERMRIAHKNKSRTPKQREAIAKLNAAKRGKPLSEAHKLAISNTEKGRPKSEEHKRKIGDAQRGKPREYTRGQKRSEETKERMRKAAKERKERKALNE